MGVRVRGWVCVWACARTRVHMRVCAHMCACVCMRACVLPGQLPEAKTPGCFNPTSLQEYLSAAGAVMRTTMFLSFPQV